MRYLHLDGVGKRIRERLIALGYIKATGAPDVARFIKEKHYDPRNFYPWVNQNRTPTGPHFVKLCEDLKCQAHWLYMGISVPEPTPGMSLTDYMGALMKDAKARERKGPKKATPRRKKLARVVAFLAVLLGGVPARAGTLDAVQVLDKVSLIRRRASGFLQDWARPLLPLGCSI